MKQKISLVLSCLRSLFDTVFSLLSVFLFSRMTSVKKQSEQEQPIAILGNGPSLKEDLNALLEISKVSRIDFCVVNDFAFSDAFFKVCPCIYVLADPNYWRENVKEEIEIRRVRLMHIFAHEVTWPMRVMMPVEAKGSSIVGLIDSKFITFEYYNRTPISGFDCVRFWLFDIGAGMPPPFNVLIAALTLSIVCGYKRIFILGADHSWHEELSLTENDGVVLAQKHFYDADVESRPVYKDGKKTFTIGELFIRWGTVFKIYEVLALYAKYKQAEVYNLSSKTYIDAFSRARVGEIERL